MSSKDVKVDLHPVARNGRLIDQALDEAFTEARQRKARRLEIIHGKGTGQLKKRVQRYLNRDDVRALYHRLDKDRDNSGRVFVHFRWPRGQ